MTNLAHALSVPTSAPQPFLKWAGGKRALLSEIRDRTPSFTGKYIEGFLGAGAVLFDQDPHRRKVISDYNNDLIEVYEVIRDEPKQLLKALRSHSNTSEHYYAVRAWDREPGFLKRNKVQRAARFIFLNKTNYNGLNRVNASGQMNVPFGKQSNPDFIQEAVILSVSDFLNQRNKRGDLLTTLLSGDYRKALHKARAGDWVYLDPPYAPISVTSSFVGYATGGFTVQDQTDLRDEIVKLTERGIPVLLSNSDVPLIRELYRDAGIFDIEGVSVRRAIAASTASRGRVSEVLINNYRAAGL